MSNLSITLIQCGECGDNYTRTGTDSAVCVCGHAVSVAADIVPHLEDGETIAWSGELLAYATV